MLEDRGENVDHSTIYRCTQHYPPEMGKHWHWRRLSWNGSWQVDEIYIKVKGKCPTDTEHRQVKYLNNVIEADHSKLKRLIKPTLDFKSRKTVYATMEGFEFIRELKRVTLRRSRSSRATRVKSG